MRRRQRQRDSFIPLGGMIPLINMQLGEIIVGGVAADLYGKPLSAIGIAGMDRLVRFNVLAMTGRAISA